MIYGDCLFECFLNVHISSWEHLVYIFLPAACGFDCSLMLTSYVTDYWMVRNAGDCCFADDKLVDVSPVSVIFTKKVLSGTKRMQMVVLRHN